MAKMTCKCGELLSTVECPNNIQFIVYSDYEWNNIIDSEIIEPWKLPRPKNDVWRCPNCKRLYVFEKGNEKAKMIYNLEE